VEGRLALSDQRIADRHRSRRDDERTDPEVAGALPIDRAVTVEQDGMRLFRTRVNGSDEQYVNPLAQPDGMPGYAMQWMEVEGPLADEVQGAGYRRLFAELPNWRNPACAVLP